MSKATLILFPAMLELSLSAYLLWKLWLERIKPIVLWDIFHGSLIPPCKFSAEPNAHIQPWFASFMVYFENRNNSRLRITRILTKKAGYDDQESVDDDRTVSVSVIKARILSPKPTQLRRGNPGFYHRTRTKANKDDDAKNYQISWKRSDDSWHRHLFLYISTGDALGEGWWE